MYFKLTFLVLTAWYCFANPIVATNTPTIPFHNFTNLPQALANIEQYILHFNNTLNFPSLLFGLSVRGRPILKKAWGIADLSNSLPANIDNRYRIGSLTKSFTSALIGQLVDAGRLHYDDLVYKYLDEKHFSRKIFNNTPVNITIRQLLTHTSGLPETETKPDVFSTLDPPANVTQQILHFKDQKLKHQPGTVFEYSNNGYQVLGAVIEAVTGQSFQQVLTSFLQKYKFPTALVADGSQIIPNIPRYYMGQDPKKPLKYEDARSRNNYSTCPYDDMLFLNGWWPAGGIVATMDDLFHYGRLLIDAHKGRPGAILTQKTLQEMWTSSSVSLGGNSNHFVHGGYGMGWGVATNNTNLHYPKMVFHKGGTLGMTSYLTVYPEEEIVAVVFANKGTIDEEELMILYAVENVYHLIK